MAVALMVNSSVTRRKTIGGGVVHVVDVTGRPARPMAARGWDDVAIRDTMLLRGAFAFAPNSLEPRFDWLL